MVQAAGVQGLVAWSLVGQIKGKVVAHSEHAAPRTLPFKQTHVSMGRAGMLAAPVCLPACLLERIVPQ